MSSYSTASCYDVNAACNGEYVKSGLAELEQWCYDATEEYGGSAWDDLKHIRQAVGFLVIHQKPKKTLNEITKDLCPALIIQQLYRINTMYWDDKYGTHTVSADVSHHFCWLLQLLRLYFTLFLFYCPRLSRFIFIKLC